MDIWLRQTQALRLHLRLRTRKNRRPLGPSWVELLAVYWALPCWPSVSSPSCAIVLSKQRVAHPTPSIWRDSVTLRSPPRKHPSLRRDQLPLEPALHPHNLIRVYPHFPKRTILRSLSTHFMPMQFQKPGPSLGKRGRQRPDLILPTLLVTPPRRCYYHLRPPGAQTFIATIVFCPLERCGVAQIPTHGIQTSLRSLRIHIRYPE